MTISQYWNSKLFKVLFNLIKKELRNQIIFIYIRIDVCFNYYRSDKKLKFKCPECKTMYNLEDRKIPQNTNIKIKCPKCQFHLNLEDNIIFDNKNDNKKTNLKTKMLENAKALPPLPEVLMKAKEIMKDETKGLKDLADVLEKDQAMATRVLKIANSAYYAIKNPVSSIREACVILGGDTLMQMITLASTAKLLGKELLGYSISAGEVFSHSVFVAFASQLIAEKKFPSLAIDAFSAGLMHDAGKLILNDLMETRKDDFNKFVSTGLKIFQAEKRLFGFDHSEIGHDFLGKWNIPDSQTKAIRWHHEPEKSEKNPLAHIIHIANSMSLLLPEENTRDMDVCKISLGIIGLNDDEVVSIRFEAIDITEAIFHGFID